MCKIKVRASLWEGKNKQQDILNFYTFSLYVFVNFII